MSAMRLDFLLQQKLTTELRMAPHIIQSIEILTLPTLELNNFIQEQLEQNPVLETQEEELDESTRNDEKAETNQEDPLDEILNDFNNLDSDEWREYFAENYGTKKYNDEKDKKFEALQNTAARPASLQDHLYQQFQLLDMPEHIRKIGEYIIFNIDAKGYLRYTLEEVIRAMGESISMDDAEQALQYVQGLEPTGVGARSIQECLLLQLEEEDDPDYEFKRELIEKYLHDIYDNKYPKIVKETGRSLEEIKAAIKSLQKLNPKPGAEYSSESTHIIIPDIVVEYIDEEYVIRLEEQYIPQLRISPSYRRLLQEQQGEKAKECTSWIKKKMESANWVIDAIKQRQRTLYRVTEEIVRHQQDFLDHGLAHLKPLKMQDVAEILSISVSTVSRAISEKYIQTPRGIFPLKFFFTGAIDKDGGENESRVSVKQRIQEIVDSEDKKNPLSDEDIAEKLKQSGLNIARRTITKYRKALGIASSRRRKIY